jgi:hypothetical protein
VEPLAAGHAVHQVIRGVDPGHGPRQRLRLQDITRDHLDLLQPRTALEPLRITHDAADAVARLQQARRQATADVAGGAGEQHEQVAFCLFHGHLPAKGWLNKERLI